MKNDEKSKVLSIISGKGGSGKTCVSLAISQMLSILKKSVLLIDLDTSTHGASYFFEPEPPGLEEWIVQFKDQIIDLSKKEIVIEKAEKEFLNCLKLSHLEPKFRHLPSKTKFESSDWDVDYVAKHINAIMPFVNRIIKSEKYDYIILDCQAGVNEVTSKALSFSTHTVIVTEADSISTKALKNLQNQFNHLFPKNTIALINKLFLEEKTTYEQLTSILRGLDFLPPIPFDMDVRNSFALGEIPLEQKKPTAYFSSIIRIVREIFPELRNTIEYMTDEIQRIEFSDYKSELSAATKKLNELKDERKNIIESISKHKEKTQMQRRLAIPLFILIVSILPIFIERFRDLFTKVSWTYISAVIGGVVVYIWIFMDIFFRKYRREKEYSDTRIQEIDEELRETEEKIDKYNTLYLTERKKLLF